MDKIDIARMPVKNGFIVVEKYDVDYKGVAICFEALNGIRMDLTYVETMPTDDDIDVYTYENAWKDDWTRKYSIDVNDLNSAAETIC